MSGRVVSLTLKKKRGKKCVRVCVWGGGGDAVYYRARATGVLMLKIPQQLVDFCHVKKFLKSTNVGNELVVSSSSDTLSQLFFSFFFSPWGIDTNYQGPKFFIKQTN